MHFPCFRPILRLYCAAALLCFGRNLASSGPAKPSFDAAARLRLRRYNLFSLSLSTPYASPGSLSIHLIVRRGIPRRRLGKQGKKTRIHWQRCAERSCERSERFSVQHETAFVELFARFHQVIVQDRFLGASECGFRAIAKAFPRAIYIFVCPDRLLEQMKMRKSSVSIYTEVKR